MQEDSIIKKDLKEKYGIKNQKELAFYIEFMKTGKSYKSYQKIYGEHISWGSASVLANRLLKKVKVDLIDWLDYAGHTTDKITEALDNLFEKDSDAYLRHIERLKQLDIQKVEHSGGVTINIAKELTREYK